MVVSCTADIYRIPVLITVVMSKSFIILLFSGPDQATYLYIFGILYCLLSTRVRSSSERYCLVWLKFVVVFVFRLSIVLPDSGN